MKTEVVNPSLTGNTTKFFKRYAKPYPSCERDLLIFPASFKRSPAAPVSFCLSEPARSTRFILLVLKELKPSAALYIFQNFS